MLTAIDSQKELLLRDETQDVDISTITRQPSMLAAINLCCSVSGLNDKQIYMELDIAAGQWTRIKSGEAHFPPNKLEELMDLCGNEIPLIWLTNRRGYKLKKLQSALERELQAERERTAELTRKLEHFAEFAKLNR